MNDRTNYYSDAPKWRFLFVSRDSAAVNRKAARCLIAELTILGKASDISRGRVFHFFEIWCIRLGIVWWYVYFEQF